MPVTSRAATALQKAILMINNDFEQRVADADTIAFVEAGTSQVVPEAEIRRVKVGTERVISIASYAKNSTTIRTGRAITASTTDSITMSQDLSWSTLGFHVHSSPIESDEQIDNAAMDLQNKLMNGIRAFVLSLSSNLETWLEASKTTVFATAPEITGITIGASSIDVDHSKFFEVLPVYMRKQALKGEFDFLTNVAFMQVMNEYLKYGAANDKNLEQFLRGVMPYYSNTITPAEGDKLKGYCVPKGSIGLLYWTEADAKRGINTPLLSYYEKTLTFNTLSGKRISIPFGVKEESGPKDMSGVISGGERAYNTEFGFYVDFAKVKVQSSTSGDTPITKVTSLLVQP